MLGIQLHPLCTSQAAAASAKGSAATTGGVRSAGHSPHADTALHGGAGAAGGGRLACNADCMHQRSTPNRAATSSDVLMDQEPVPARSPASATAAAGQSNTRPDTGASTGAPGAASKKARILRQVHQRQQQQREILARKPSMRLSEQQQHYQHKEHELSAAKRPAGATADGGEPVKHCKLERQQQPLPPVEGQQEHQDCPTKLLCQELHCQHSPAASAGNKQGSALQLASWGQEQQLLHYAPTEHVWFDLPAPKEPRPPQIPAAMEAEMATEDTGAGDFTFTPAAADSAGYLTPSFLADTQAAAAPRARTTKPDATQQQLEFGNSPTGSATNNFTVAMASEAALMTVARSAARPQAAMDIDTAEAGAQDSFIANNDAQAQATAAAAQPPDPPCIDELPVSMVLQGLKLPGLENIAAILEREMIYTLAVLSKLQKSDYRAIGVPLGAALQIIDKCRELLPP